MSSNLILKINSSLIKSLIRSRSKNMTTFAEEHGINYKYLAKVIHEGECGIRTAEKIAAFLDVDVNLICRIPKAEKPYWWHSDSEYPVDINFCKKCSMWDLERHWCNYLEKKGILRPDNTIIVNENGKNTCSVRELRK